VGTFTAASNITGICLDVDEITALLHRYGALAFWDYATAAPYIHVDMNPTERQGGGERGGEGVRGSVTAADTRTPRAAGRLMEERGEGREEGGVLPSTGSGTHVGKGQSRVPFSSSFSTTFSSSSPSSSSSSAQRPNYKKDAIFFSGHKFVGGPGTYVPSPPPSLPSAGPPRMPVVQEAFLCNKPKNIHLRQRPLILIDVFLD